MTAAALAAAAAALLIFPSRAVVPGVGRRRAARQPRAANPGSGRVRVLLGIGVALAIAGLTKTAGGLVVGLVTGFAVFAFLARRASTDRPLEDEARRQLPLVLEAASLLLDAGLPAYQAIELAALSCGPALHAPLRRVSQLNALGGSTAAWQPIRGDPVLGPVARAAERSAASGASLAADWRRQAQAVREEARTVAEVKAGHAGIAVLAPVGLCFLPAFVCLGIVPIVIGLATQFFA